MLYLLQSVSDDWNRLANHHPNATFVDLPVWRRLLSRSFNIEHVTLGYRQDKNLLGSLGLFLISRLGQKHGASAPLSASGGGFLWDSTSTARNLLQSAEQLAANRKLRYVQIYLPIPIPLDMGEIPNWHADDRFVRFILELSPDLDNIWKQGIRGKTRNQVRKARKENFEFKTGSSEVEAFHEVLNLGTRDMGSPCPSLKFFQAIAKEMGGAATFIVARHEGRPAAAALLLHHNKTSALPWAISLQAYRKHCLNMLLYWNIIEQAVKAGSRKLDMGRSMKGSGTYSFKKNFGGIPESLYYYYFKLGCGPIPLAHPEDAKFSMIQKIWSRIPPSITARLGHSAIGKVI